MRLVDEEVDLDDMDFDNDQQYFSYPCPCGDVFIITVQELSDGEMIGTCPSCSLIIRVLFDEETIGPVLQAFLAQDEEGATDDDTSGYEWEWGSDSDVKVNGAVKNMALKENMPPPK